MNVRLFIGEIKKRKPLWDQSNKNYHNKKVLVEQWREVAKTFNIEVQVAKQKWKNLRDTFRVELKKSKKYSDDGDGMSRSLWSYYEDMSFIKDILRTRKLRELVEPESWSPEATEHAEQTIKTELDADVTLSPERLADVAEENRGNIVIKSVTSLQQIDDVDTTQYQGRRSGRWKRSFDEEHQEFGDEDQDDDLLFFRSLMPFVKKMDQDKKLLFRMNVQQLLYNQLYT